MNTITAENAYRKKKVRLAKFGLFIAWVSSLCMVAFPIFNSLATDKVYQLFDSKILTLYVLSLLFLSFGEFLGGIFMMLYQIVVRGVPVKEFARTWSVKSSRMVLLSALVAGPVATACVTVSVPLCGSTYSNCICALTPVLTAIAASIFLKEKIGPRVIVGILIAVAGVIVAGFTAPEGVNNFYLGILVALVAPIGYTAEAIISTHVMDVSEPLEVCSLYRMVGAGIMEFLIVVIICAISGNLAWIGIAFGVIFSSPVLLLFILITSILIAIQYGTSYIANNYSGPARASAVVWSTPIWSIPIGLLFSASGLVPYNVTTLGIVGAVIVVVGVVLVLAKPSELFNLRKFEE